MASDDDIEKLKTQKFEEPIKHDGEVGPVGNLFGSCVQILQALSTKARELDAASRKNYHPDGPQRSESANESSSAHSRKEGRVRKRAKPGCVTCKKRKKKCDEGKPECNKCVRDGFICDGYIFKSTSKKPEAPNSNSSGQGTETCPKSGQRLPLDGVASQLLVKTLESNLATLIFWDDEFGALSGHLDKALEHSEENRDLTLATLISLADFLSHDLLNATFPLPAYRDDIRQKSNIHARVDKARGIIMDTEAPDREETRDIQDVCEILDSKVARLNVLGPILEESIPSGAAFEQVAAYGQLDDRPAHQYYADQIRIRFPNASASLVEVLGKCNWERYMRIHKAREENTQREGSPIGETENMSKFHDSGLGTSVPAQSAFGVPQRSVSYAETEVSKRAEASHRRLPPLPEEGRKGWPFVCDICNSIVRIRRTGAWKKHVFSDVLAYVCIFDECSSERCFFEDRDALIAHLGNQHGFAPTWKSAICPLCLEETGDGMNAISLHFTRHMEEVALGAIPRTAESDAGSEESSTMASSENGRSNSFELDEGSREKGMCPVEGCGRVFRDLKAHMLTHIGERPEKCPITTCKYHLKGFATKYDKNRHTLTHYKGTMVCGFCSGSGSVAVKSFNRVDVFKRHMISVHGVEQTIPNSRKKTAYNSTSAAGTCSTCSVTFADAREFYLHLDDCILRVIQQADPAEATNQQLLSSIADDEDVKETLNKHLLLNETTKHYDDGSLLARPISVKDRPRQESTTASSLLNGMSWGGVSVGSWIRDDIVMAGTSSYAFGRSPSFHSSSYLPKMDAPFMKDFNCCGLTLDNLHDLLQHFEECHATPSATMQRSSISGQGGFNAGQSSIPASKTISPKDALLGYQEAEEDSMVPFPPGASQDPSQNYAQQQQPSTALPPDMGMQQQDSYVHQDSPPNSSLDQGGQANSRRQSEMQPKNYIFADQTFDYFKS